MKFKLLFSILLITVVVLGGILIIRIQPNDKKIQTIPTVTSPPQQIEYLELKDQVVKDDILIDKAILEKPSFIAIHKSIEGKPGEVIASSRLLTGEQKNVVIYIKTPPAIGELLYAMIHVDNGDGIHEFPGSDTFQLDDQDQPYMKKFTVIAP